MFCRKEWNLHRAIKDKKNGDAVVKGTAKFSRIKPRTFLWQEAIDTHTEQGVIEGFQSYKIVRDGFIIDVFYDVGLQKGKLFQRFNLKHPREVAKHLCGADEYLSTLQIDSRKKMMVMHHVKGPSKDYVMKTMYQV